MSTTEQKSIPPYVPPAHFVAWLDEEPGRAAYFSKVDPGLFPPLISKMKAGLIPITMEYAVRLERAQKPSANRLEAESLMTFLESRQWYRYAIGKDAPPPPVEVIRQPRTSARKALTQAEA
jgi:hypothetical protein